MPNFAANQLIVTGAPSSLKEFSDAAAGVTYEGEPTPLSFEALLPTPAHLLENAGETAHGPADFVIRMDGTLDTSAEGCLDWREDHWGVKWELCEPAELRSEPGKLTFWFDTAWRGPARLIMEMAQRFPALNFELVYVNDALSYAGVVSSEKGEPKDFEVAFMNEAGALDILDRFWPNAAADWRDLIELDREAEDAAQGMCA